MSSIQKVEIVVPAHKGFPKREYWVKLVAVLGFALPIRTLLVFWFVATWFPELGLTFWQLILPVYVASMIFRPIGFKGRWIPRDRLWKSRETAHNADTGVVTRVDTLTELATPKTTLKV